ncbi:MAG: ribosomal protein S18-alanine N-acetyltransferase, partial [Acetanaerobacterium sp.]
MADSFDRQPAQIVPFLPEHLQRLADLERECFSSPWSYDGLLEELSNPMAVFRVAHVDSEVAGYAGMQHILDEGYITNVAVSKPFRRRGIAAQLLHTLLAYGKENDMAFISLEVRVSNSAAIALYRS